MDVECILKRNFRFHKIKSDKKQKKGDCEFEEKLKNPGLNLNKMVAKENVVNKEESDVGVEDMEGRMIKEKNKDGRDRRQCGMNYL